MIGLIDTNLFGKFKNDEGGMHETFLRALGDEADATKWKVTHFGFLEYIGLSVPNLSSRLDPMPEGWTPPGGVLDPRIRSDDPQIREVASQLGWVRSKAKENYAALVTHEEMDKKAAEERTHHEDPFKNGPFDEPLFRRPLATYHPDAFAELLAIDYVHRHEHFPAGMSPLIRRLCRATIIHEYYDERRNVALSRSFKQSWLNRTKGPHESHIAAETMANLEIAMKSIKPNSDRFDLDLLVYFLLGFAVDGVYEPVTIYTKDEPGQVLPRLAVFFNILSTAWEESSHLDKVGPLPIQRTSRYRFVCDHGNVLKEITSDDLVRYLLTEGLIALK